MFFSGATGPQERRPLSLFMSYLSCPATSFVLYKVAFWDGQNQTHIFLVSPTQSGVKQHKGLVRLQEEESTPRGRGARGEESKWAVEMSRGDVAEKAGENMKCMRGGAYTEVVVVVVEWSMLDVSAACPPSLPPRWALTHNTVSIALAHKQD